MIEKYYNYLQLLKSFIHQSKPSLSQDVDWQAVMNQAGINGTLGIIGFVMMSNSGLADPDLTVLGRRRCMAELMQFAQRAEKMKLLIHQMNENGIDHLLFKGFVVREFYPVPELRTFGDIDFVIRKEDRQKSDALMMELGFERKTDWEPVYSYIKDNEYYEIHTDVMEIDVSDKADYRGYYSQIWDQAVNTVEHTYEFRPEFHLLYLLTHIAKHIHGSGAGIRMYMDIALFILHYGDSLDWKYIEEQLAVLKFETFGNLVFTAVQEWFGVTSPIALQPLEEGTLDDFTEFTLEGGVFGSVGRDSGLNYLRNDAQSEDNVSKGTVLLRRLFPSASTIEQRYTYLQGRHWLLPIAWVHRLFKTRDTWGAHAQQARTIMTADDAEVLKMRRLRRTIGL